MIPTGAVPLRTGRLVRGTAGGATTELAILLLILVPLTLYSFYLQSALYHQLEVQETVISTVWDYSTRSWVKEVYEDPLHEVDGYNRVTFADHTSTFVDERRVIPKPAMSKQSEAEHHNQAFAHVCWCDGKSEPDCGSHGSEATHDQKDYDDRTEAQQVSCANKKNAGSSLYFLDTNFNVPWFHIGYTHPQAGVVTCWAKGWLYNYVIGPPQSTLSQRGGEYTELTFRGGDTSGQGKAVHSIGKSGTNILLRDRAALMVDTWAIADTRNLNLSVVGSTPNKQFFNRTNRIFTNPLHYFSVTGKVNSYKNAAKPFVNVWTGWFLWFPQTMIPGNLGMQNPNALQMITRPAGAKVGGFFTTPFYDEDQRAYQERGRHYLGTKNTGENPY